MDISKLRSEMLRAIRGRRTQGSLSRKLGYRFNQVYRWESGHTKIPWPRFVMFCASCKVDLAGALQQVLGYDGDPGRADLLVKNIIAPASREFLKERVAISRYVISHWLSGRSTPSLDDILLLVHRVTFAIVELAERLVDLSSIPSLAPEVHHRKLRKEILLSHPYLEAVLCSLEMTDYQALARHRSGFVAERVGISVSEEKEVLSKLVEAGCIRFVRGKYSLQEDIFESFDIRGDFEAVKQIKSYWFERAASAVRIRKKNSRDDLFIYYTFSVDTAGAAEIGEEAAKFLQRVIDIAEKRPKRPDQVRQLNLQFLDLAAYPAFSGGQKVPPG